MSESAHSNEPKSNSTNHDLDTLRNILLRDDRLVLQELQQILNEKTLLSERVSPIISDHLEYMKTHFPIEFRKEVEKIFDVKIEASQDALLNVIYPKLGEMIRKYISYAINELRASIESQVKSTFDTKTFKRKFRAWWNGVSESDLIMAEMQKPELQEVHIIEAHSGILMGSASATPTLDREAVAGMLTAIKAFAEDAFQQENAELNAIQYGQYQLYIKHIHSYYIVLALSGSTTEADREKYEELMLAFTRINALKLVKSLEHDAKDEVSVLLHNFYFDEKSNKL